MFAVCNDQYRHSMKKIDILLATSLKLPGTDNFIILLKQYEIVLSLGLWVDFDLLVGCLVELLKKSLSGLMGQCLVCKVSLFLLSIFTEPEINQTVTF